MLPPHPPVRRKKAGDAKPVKAKAPIAKTNMKAARVKPAAKPELRVVGTVGKPSPLAAGRGRRIGC